MQEAMRRKVEVAGVEAILYTTTAGKGVPVVFVAHGRGGSHDDNAVLCERLLEAGYTAISIEQRNHGKRLVEPLSNAAWDRGNNSHAVDMYGQVVGTAHDCSLLIDFLPTKFPEVSMDSGIGVCGVSQGGHLALSLLVNEPRVDVAVALIGAGDYETNMRLRYSRLLKQHEERKTTAPPWHELWPERLTTVVNKYDAICNLDRFGNRPCLLLNGAADTLVPPASNAKLVAALREAGHYTGPAHRQLQMVVYDGVGHSTPPPMISDAIGWFQAKLPAGRAAAKL